MSHLSYTLLMALLVSGATVLPGNDSTRNRCHRAVYVFFTCTMSILVGGWFMYLVHR